MEIHIGRGVGDLLLGSTAAAILEQLGKPDKIDDISNADNRHLIYYGQKLVLQLDPKQADRLSWIRVHNPQATWNAIQPWQADREALLAMLSEALGEQPEFEDYGQAEYYFFRESWVELHYEFGELYAFNIGVLYGQDDQPQWPVTAT
jgi:hypothetical protein